MSKYRIFAGPYFPVFSPNAGKYGPEKAPYLDNFHAVLLLQHIIFLTLIVIYLLRNITRIASQGWNNFQLFLK